MAGAVGVEVAMAIDTEIVLRTTVGKCGRGRGMTYKKRYAAEVPMTSLQLMNIQHTYSCIFCSEAAVSWNSDRGAGSME